MPLWRKCSTNLLLVLRNLMVVSSRRESSMKVLNVAEKNDAAKSLSDLMSNGGYRRREGLSKFNKIYEFNYRLLNQNCDMLMTSVSGHLLNYEFVGQYRRWNSCAAVTLFDAPVNKACPEDFQNIKRTIEREVRGCQILVVWTDGDREGENIGFEIINVCKAIKPNIRVYRARFSEITPGAIQRACDNLVEPDQNTSDAVDVRQELDLRIGAAFTRFQTQRLQRVFPTVLADQLISYGSCQFPTLGFVVERYKEIQNFIAENFWKIKVSHKTDEGNVDFAWKRNRLFDHTACLVLYQHCLESPLATVDDVQTKNKTKWRPVALDTVELEKMASRKLRLTAKETMRVAEKLYTSGFISYPRTETNQFPKDLDFGTLIQNQTVSGQWGEFASRVLNDGPNPRNGNKSDQAHPPIHPIKFTDNLQGSEARVYEFIVRHFLACCSQDARGCETVVQIDIAQEKFSANGLMILERNYLDVYPYENWNAKTIPIFEPGQQFNPSSIEMNQSETCPPNLLTEADLIALMDKHGIGTDATHAEHIETIKSRMYVGMQGDGKFVPGELGMGLCDGYDAMGYEMSKPNLRSELEADLKLICQGRRDKDMVLREQIDKYKEVFIEATKQADKLDGALSQYFGEAALVAVQPVVEPEEVMKCSQCASMMTLKTKKDGKGYFVTCMGFPDCKNAIWLPEFVLNASVSDDICPTCRPAPVHKIRFKFKRGSVPPNIPTEYVGCIGGCEIDLNEVLDIRLRGPSQRQTSARSENDSGYSSSYNSTLNRSTQRSATPNARSANSQGGASQRGGANNRGSMATPRGGLQFRDPSGTSRGGGRGYHSNAGGAGQRAPSANFGQPAAPPVGGDGNNIVCTCGQDAKLLNVRKEGPNQGRPFYRCGSQDGGCNFFLWADAPDATSGDGDDNQTRQFDRARPARVTPNHGGGHVAQNYGGGGGGGDDVQCNCGEQAKQLTAKKEGPNKGRPFYACPKGQGQGCNFFQWGDEDNAARGCGGRGATGQRPPAGGGGEGRAQNQKKRRCGQCGQEGHNRKTCPNQ